MNAWSALLLVFAGMYIASCNNSSWFHQEGKKKGSTYVYAVAPIPTDPDSQKTDKQYILDYEIINVLSLPRQKLKQLKKELNKGGNFSQFDIKRCVFMGKYAVCIDSAYYYVISEHPCSKIIIKTTENERIENMDLVRGNKIEEILNGITE